MSRTQNQINKLKDKKTAILHEEAKKINQHIENNFEKLMTKGLKPEEQSNYNQLIQELKEAGVTINKNTTYTEELEKSIRANVTWGFKKRKKFRRLQEKISSTNIPKEYQEILDNITELKNNPDIEVDTTLQTKLKKLETKRRIYIKKNTPQTIRNKITKEIKKQNEKKLEQIEQKINKLKEKQNKIDKSKRDNLLKIQENIKSLTPHWYKKAHQTYKKPSEFIKSTIKRLQGKKYHNYNQTIKDEIQYTKYSIFEGGDVTKFDKVTEFYTDNSNSFNKYVHLKNRGATKKELDEIIEQEWYQEIFDKETQQFKTNIKNKYKNIKSKKELKQLFEEIETNLIQKAVPLEENTVTFSAQNLEHYLDLQIGDSLPNTGFTSTTLSEKETLFFAQKQKRKRHEIALIEFHIDEGVEVNKILQSAIKEYRQERELVIPPGYEMKVISRNPDVLKTETAELDVEKFVVEIMKKEE